MDFLRQKTVFSEFDANFLKNHSIREMRLRLFGTMQADLKVNFITTPRPLLSIQILKLCTYSETEAIDDIYFYDLPVGMRIEALFELASLPYGSRLELCFVCEDDACKSKMELEISAREISSIRKKAYVSDTIEVDLNGKKIFFKRPTGANQREWIRRESISNVDMIAALIADENSKKSFEQLYKTKGHDSKEMNDHIKRIEAAMEEADPLTHFTLTTQCPECSHENRYLLNLEDICLRLLQRAQQKLLLDIHRLAFVYHWSENEILRLPHWRRDYYLNLIERGTGA